MTTVFEKIRAYDFQPMASRPDCYVEGMVLEIVQRETMGGGSYQAFKILCEVDYWDGEPMVDEHSRVGKIVYVPLPYNTYRDFDGRVVKLA